MANLPLSEVKIVVAHRVDADGLGSALLTKYTLPHVDIQLVDYGPERNALKAQPGMLFVDMTPPDDRVDEFVEAGAIVIDHHVKQKWIVDRFGERGVFSDEPGVSAALLVLREVVRPGDTIAGPDEPGQFEEYARLIGIRDTWLKDHPLWKYACRHAQTIEFYGLRYWLARMELTSLFPFFTHQEMEVGRILERNQEELVQQLAEEVIVVHSSGKKICIAPAHGRTTSDLAEYLRTEKDLQTLATFWYSSDGQQLHLNVSLRSTEIDVGEVAVKMGGGGHKNAAGFESASREPFGVIMEAFEGT